MTQLSQLFENRVKSAFVAQGDGVFWFCGAYWLTKQSSFQGENLYLSRFAN